MVIQADQEVLGALGKQKVLRALGDHGVQGAPEDKMALGVQADEAKLEGKVDLEDLDQVQTEGQPLLVKGQVWPIQIDV